MSASDGSVSCYFFDIDDHLLFLPTRLHLWNAETRAELPIGFRDFAGLQNELGRPGKWQAWSARAETWRDFCDQPGVATGDQAFMTDLKAAIANGTAWQGRSWPLLVHAAKHERPVAIVTNRGHDPQTIEAGLRELVSRRLLAAMPPILGIYALANESVRTALGVVDPGLAAPSLRKLAIRDAVERALRKYGATPAHRFGLPDDEPGGGALAISALRDCKVARPDQRFFIVRTNRQEFVKLEVFPMDHPVTASAAGAGVLRDHPGQAPSPAALSSGGTVSVPISNLDRAIDFYTNKLGLPLKTRAQGEWAEIDAGKGLVIRLYPAPSRQAAAPGTMGAIGIELAASTSLDEVVAALSARGVQFAGAIQNHANVRRVSLKDPDNNALLLAQALDP